MVELNGCETNRQYSAELKAKQVLDTPGQVHRSKKNTLKKIEVKQHNSAACAKKKKKLK
jgi:hypothetical protein